MLEGHTDVVTEGEGWTVDPFGAVDGKLYGRGSADMKGGVVAMLFATDALVRRLSGADRARRPRRRGGHGRRREGPRGPRPHDGVDAIIRRLSRRAARSATSPRAPCGSGSTSPARRPMGGCCSRANPNRGRWGHDRRVASCPGGDAGTTTASTRPRARVDHADRLRPVTRADERDAAGFTLATCARRRRRPSSAGRGSSTSVRWSTGGVVRTSTHIEAPAGITFICAGSPARSTVGVIHTWPRCGCSP